MVKKVKKHHVGWPLTIFLLSIILAIFGIASPESSSTFILLGIYLITAAIFIRTL